MRRPSEQPAVDASETGFVLEEDDGRTLWEAIEITGEKPGFYKIRWAGIDPDTGKPWKQSWSEKEDCTEGLIREWEHKQAAKASERKGMSSPHHYLYSSNVWS
jgi:hypothetical protein